MASRNKTAKKSAGRAGKERSTGSYAHPEARLEPATPVTLVPLVTLAMPATLTTLAPVFPVTLAPPPATPPPLPPPSPMSATSIA